MLRVIKKLLGVNHYPPVAPGCPQGVRIYCIGDIHGRVDLLQQLHATIAEDAADHMGSRKIIYLGDYIDRGEESMAVIDCLLNQPLPGFETIYLRGNHEQTMLDFLQQAEIGQGWLAYGGTATLVSYGVRVSRIPARQEDYIALQQNLASRLPQAHLEFLRMTRLSYSSGSYYFVHAGVRPGIPLNRQTAEDQLWIRDEFLSCRKHYEQIIVHGHTISEESEIRPNRIGIDTGAYMSGKLTALVLEGSTRRLIQTHV